jgi:hypothetical protein
MKPGVITEIMNDKTLTAQEQACLIYQDCSMCPYGEAYQITETWRYRCTENEGIK